MVPGGGERVEGKCRDMARTHNNRQYVGIRVDTGKLERFQYVGTPVRETHGDLYAAVIGPFRTVRGAKFMQRYGANNPHLQHVNDAERLAKQG